MNECKVLKIQRHFEGMPLPGRAHPEDAGLDLTAMAVEALRPGVFSFDTGISIELPPRLYAEVAPRSSIVKTDFLLANSLGVIDPAYRGRIKVVLRYLGKRPDHGQGEAEGMLGGRIAQLLIRRVEAILIEPVETLNATQRGQGGFGSTGR